MGYLAATGAYLIIGLAVGFIVMVVGLFVGHIILFDSIALGILSGVCCGHFLTLHPALCLLVGVAVFALLLFGGIRCVLPERNLVCQSKS